ncbi:MAG: hypothetical protein WA729_14520, partial [Pseudolabrys sp.]
ASFFEVNDLRLFWRAYGRDAEVIDWLDELTAECPKDIAQNMKRSMRCAVPGFASDTVRSVFNFVNIRLP